MTLESKLHVLPMKLLEIMNTRINTLNLPIKGTIYERAIKKVEDELKREGIILDLNFYVSTEWGTDDKTSNIGVPFWALEKRLQHFRTAYTGNKAYSNTFSDAVDLMRHEAGHALCYRFELWRKKDFRRIFNVKGRFYDNYPDYATYMPRVGKHWRDYVNPNDDNYAIISPDEDFAETFSVYLKRTEPQWRIANSRRNGALEKLEYMASLVSDIQHQKPVIPNNPEKLSYPASELTLTARRWFRTEIDVLLRKDNKASRKLGEKSLRAYKRELAKL